MFIEPGGMALRFGVTQPPNLGFEGLQQLVVGCVQRKRWFLAREHVSIFFVMDVIVYKRFHLHFLSVSLYHSMPTFEASM